MLRSTLRRRLRARHGRARGWPRLLIGTLASLALIALVGAACLQPVESQPAAAAPVTLPLTGDEEAPAAVAALTPLPQVMAPAPTLGAAEASAATPSAAPLHAATAWATPAGGVAQATTRPAPSVVPWATPAGLDAAGSAQPQGVAPRAAGQPVLAVPGSRAGATAAPTGSQRVTVLLLGTDTRPSEPPVGRTDTMIVVTFDPASHSSGMISLARDLLVPIPGYQDPAKINTAHVLGAVNKYPGGGPGLASATVAQLLGYPVNYWVRVNFDGFRQIIDQIGGIDIDVAQAIADPEFPDDNYGYAPLYIPAGLIHMDGALALKYARTRHQDSDYGRARRQQQVVLAVKDRLMQPGHLPALLPRIPGLLLTLARSVQTNMPVSKILEVAQALGQGDLAAPARVVIDDSVGRNSSDPTWGFVLIPDMRKVRAAAGSVFTGKPQPAATPPGYAAEAARVAVLNGTHEPGLALRVAGALSADGLRIVGTGDADNPDYSQNWLIVRRQDLAPLTQQALAQRFAIAPDHIIYGTGSAAADLWIVLGSNPLSTSK